MKTRSEIAPGLLGLVLAVQFLGDVTATAEPRSQVPPFPDFAPWLWRADFDAPYWPGTNRADVLTTDDGTLVSSWSGYALERAGTVSPLLVPGLVSGHTNLTCGSSAASLRLWVTPYWTSVSSTNSGTGQGA